MKFATEIWNKDNLSQVKLSKSKNAFILYIKNRMLTTTFLWFYFTRTSRSVSLFIGEVKRVLSIGFLFWHRLLENNTTEVNICNSERLVWLFQWRFACHVTLTLFIIFIYYWWTITSASMFFFSPPFYSHSMTMMTYESCPLSFCYFSFFIIMPHCLSIIVPVSILYY